MFLIAKSNVLVVCFVFLHLLHVGYGNRTRDRMYEVIESASPCFRRMNATHQVGCSSERGGSIGVIHFCRVQSDLDFILANGTAPPYAPVIPTTLFTAQNADTLIRHAPKISGLVVYVASEPPPPQATPPATPLTTPPTYYSHDLQCPNERFNIDDTCASRGSHSNANNPAPDSAPLWNPNGTGLLFRDFPFPIFYVGDEHQLTGVKECFARHNNFSYHTQRDRALCALQLSSFMHATSNTPTCVRRSNTVTNLNPTRFCDPLGGQNVWATALPLVNADKPRPPPSESRAFNDSSPAHYIVVAARLDTTSMFDRTAGATSPITGIVSLLVTARYLKQLLGTLDPAHYQRNVLFLLLNGETYDYIGSQRLVYDMSRGDFPPNDSSQRLPPIKPEQIDLFVELSQLGAGLMREGVVLHYLHQSNPITADFVLALRKFAPIGLNVTEQSDSLPPASLHTFVRHRPDSAGLVLADHRREYSNRYYNSLYDNATNIDYHYLNLTSGDGPLNDKYDSNDGSVKNDRSIQSEIAKVASMVAKALYVTMKGNVTFDVTDVIEKEEGAGHVTTSDDMLALVDELLHCYLEAPDCKVHRAIQKTTIRDQQFNWYVSVKPSLVTTLIGLTLGWLLGDDLGEASANCTSEIKGFPVYNMSASLDDLNSTRCYRFQMNWTDAVSPAFIMDDYDWSSGKYSSWTESTWYEIRLRAFLKPSAAHETMTIAIGSMVFIFSLIFVYFVKSRSDMLFPQPVATQAPTRC